VIFFDLEATGPDPVNDRIVQFSFLPEGGPERTALVNPGRPIPPEVAALTGIADADVAAAPPFAEVAEGLAAMIAGQVLVGFGCIHFDVPLLAEEFERAGVSYEFGPVIDCGTLFKLHHPRTLAAAVRTYLGRDLDGAHRADADARATRRVYYAQRGQFAAIDGLDPAAVALASNHGKGLVDPHGKLALIDGRVCFNTHRNRGVPVADDLGYAEWMLRSDFPAATKRALRAELDRIDAEASVELFAAAEAEVEF
jgi:DNA polymerase-3 subunit epsilon